MVSKKDHLQEEEEQFRETFRKYYPAFPFCRIIRKDQKQTYIHAAEQIDRSGTFASFKEKD